MFKRRLYQIVPLNDGSVCGHVEVVQVGEERWGQQVMEELAKYSERALLLPAMSGFRSTMGQQEQPSMLSRTAFDFTLP